MKGALVWLALVAPACAHRGDAPAIGRDASSDAGSAWSPGLGAQWSPDGSEVSFAVASSRATRIELDVFDAATGAAPVLTLPLAQTGDVFSALVPAGQLPAVIYYGYRAWGPNWPYDASWVPGSAAGWIADVDGDGNRMNPNKLVFDPYARELSHDPETPDQASGTPYAVGSNRDVDSAPVAPKGIVVADDPPDFGTKPTRALRDDVIYEVHVRGFTQGLGSATGATCAGTYAGAAAQAGYLASLGITAVEFLPIAETQNDRNDVDPASDSGDNYWGYSTLAYFAPDRRYACDRTPGGPTREVRAMVQAFHAAGIKVLLDVVYNHTAEGAGSSLLTLRGLDNAGYYALDAAKTGFTNSNGVGADVAAQQPLAQGLILDSLAYWKDTIGVDGFRFDLAPVLGNVCGPGCFTFDPNSLPSTIAQRFARPTDGGDGADLIAEPWAVVANSYEVGQFPAGWSEWNDHVRDTIRQDQNGANATGTTPNTPSQLATRIAGSSDLYASRGPQAGVTYLVSHDGFTLHDLYACDAPNNTQAWPYGPSSGGSTTNYAWDHGGDAVQQRQATRTGMALELLSAGVPMIAGGDELAHGIQCNNNPYDLDSVATWLDYTAQTDILWTFTQRMLAFRAAHPALRPAGWSSPTWFDGTGAIASTAYMATATEPVVAWTVGGTSDPIYVAYDRGAADVTITIPAAPNGLTWYRVADTGAWDEPGANIAAPGSEYMMHQASYALGARSLALFIAK
ncbi:MAG TPA: alpha-amylase family glycosyl hydrolase [Kofleriaceae bacterium]|jgi:glycogen operon protein